MQFSDIYDLRRLGVIQEREEPFTLKSGLKSNMYFDFRRLVAAPHLLRRMAVRVAGQFGKFAAMNERVHICGVPHGAVPLATAVSQVTGLRQLILRKETKKHGTGKLLEGVYEPGDSVILIDDVWTTGGSLREAMASILGQGLNVIGSVVLLNRSGKELEKGIYALADDKFMSQPQNHTDLIRKTAKMTDLRSVRLLEIMYLKKSNLCLAADLESIHDVLKMIEKVGHSIVMLKLHIDTLQHVDYGTLVLLNDAAARHQILLCEDRKFGDIGATNLKYMKRWHLDQWADFATCHVNAGPEAIKMVQQSCSPILIGSMSSNPDPFYDVRAAEMAENLHVAGIVTQNPVSDPEYLVFTPGIHLEKKNDEMGQRYSSPEEKIARGSDILIVGRGICQADDPAKAAEHYREVCWKAYERLHPITPLSAEPKAGLVEKTESD